MIKKTPNFQSDGCPKCEYLGSDSKYDYYTCLGGDKRRTYIARYGNKPWQYYSAPIDDVVGGYKNFPKKSPVIGAYKIYKGMK